MKHILKRTFSKVFIIGLFVFTASTAFSQYSETLGSGRPGNANGAATVGKDVLQFQAGVQISGYNSDLGPNYSEFSENLVIRYGLLEHLEFSAVINQANGTIKSNVDESSVSGFNSTMLRARVKVIDNLAIQVGLDMPILRNDFNNDYSSPQIKVMYSTIFNDNLSLTTNLGAQWDDVKNDPDGFYVFSFSAALPSAFSLVLEAYGDFNTTGLRHYYDAGIAYLVNPDLLIDVNAGWGNNHSVESYFVTTGVSYRMKLKKD